MSCVKKCTSRKGFTLVELLIVIVVIGILSAMMMLSSTEAVSSARANNIVSNLRNLKTAVLSWYADNLDRMNNLDKGITKTDGTASNQDIQNYFKSNPDEIKKYLGNSNTFNLNTDTKDGNGCAKDAGDYGIMNASNSAGASVRNKHLYIATKIGDTKVQEKLKARAESQGLLKSNNKNGGKYDGGNIVYMHVLSLE